MDHLSRPLVMFPYDDPVGMECIVHRLPLPQELGDHHQSEILPHLLPGMLLHDGQDKVLRGTRDNGALRPHNMISFLGSDGLANASGSSFHRTEIC